MFNIEAVLEYQAVDNEIRKIEADLEKSEYAQAARKAQENFREAKERAAALEKNAESYVVYYHKARQFFDENSKKIAELAEKLKTDSDSVDFEKLKSAVLALGERLLRVDKDLSDISRKQEEISREFALANKKGAQAKQDFNANKASLEKLKEQKTEELEALKQKRNSLEKNLEPAIKEKYKALRKDRSSPFVALEAPNKCGGCRMEMALDKLAALRENGYASCESCGRVVYIKRN